MTRLPISVCMISGAEAGRIGRSLESVAGWTTETVVVLNEEVRDDTEKIAHQHGARVFREPWKGFMAQKNSAAEKAGQPWILGLDADEAVSPQLRDELAHLFADAAALESFAAYSCPRLSWFCGRWIRHGDWYPDRVTRLWQKGAATWTGIGIHERLEVKGKTGRLHSNLLHFSNSSINQLLGKIVPYSDPFVEHCLAVGRMAGWLDLTVRPIWKFVRAYFFRLGCLDGWPGLYIAWLGAFSTLTRYTKLREARLKPTK
jgi:hypothetical protein